MKNVVQVVVALVIPFGVLLILEGVLAIIGIPKDELIGYSHPSHFEEQRKHLEFEYTFATNDQGLRYRDIPLKRTGNEIRVLLLGDSFTEGYGVEANETFGAALERRFARLGGAPVEFINGGLSGAGPLQYWRLFSVVGLRYDVDGLLICLGSNDVADTPESLSHGDLHDLYPRRRGIRNVLHKLFPRTQTLIKRLKTKKPGESSPKRLDFVLLASNEARRLGFPESRIDEWKAKLPEELVAAVNDGQFNGRTLSFGLINPYVFENSLDIPNEWAERKFRSMITVLNETVKKAAENGIEVGVVYLPNALQYDPAQHESNCPLVLTGTRVRREWLTEQTEIQKRLDTWADAAGVPFLDLTPAFRDAYDANDGLNYKLDGHWSPDGHRVAADAIADWIERGGCFAGILP